MGLKQTSFLTVILILFCSPIYVIGQDQIECSKNGPFVDKIIFISNIHEPFMALQINEIDLMTSSISPAEISQLVEAEDISTTSYSRNGYGYFAINCDKYPFNITAFRRAFAFALDKVAICDEGFEGMANPIDSVIPSINPWSIEDSMPYTYYETDIDMGNMLLDNANFLNVDEDIYREAPDGSDFSVTLECSHSSYRAMNIVVMAQEALQSLGIEATSEPTDFYEYLYRFNHHGDYDILFLGTTYPDFDCDYFAHNYHSDNIDVDFMNAPMFQNMTFDGVAEELVRATSFEEVFELVLEMQRILIYECPIIPLYENEYIIPFRNDKFKDFMIQSDIIFWTLYTSKLKESSGGPTGGILRVHNHNPESFNPMATNSMYSHRILRMLYDSLIKIGPDGFDVNWLCETYTIRTRTDDPNIPEGYTRITFDIIRNATWTDGMLLTGEDIAFSLNYHRDTVGNRYGFDLDGMTAAYAPTPYRVIVEFDSESYWNLHSVCYKPILPKHIFEDIGLDGWNTWNPTPPDDIMITSGPFYVSDHVEGEFTEITRNENYFYKLPQDSTSNSTDPEPLNFLTIGSFVIAGMISAACVILVGSYVIFRKPQ